MKYFFECCDCGKKYTENFLYLCPECSKDNSPGIPPRGVLFIRYYYEQILPALSGIEKFETLKSRHYIDILPLKSINSFPNLRVGNTPVYPVELSGDFKPINQFFVKDDSQNPTFSFKDRASALVSAFAKENGIHEIVAASTGNAGSSLAGICAAASQKAIIIVPKNIPPAKLLQIVMYGATPVLIDGNYDDAFELSLKASKEFGWFNRNTAYNPLTIEGKKSAALEIFDFFREKMPDLIFVPVGDGVILSGIYKGFEDLLKLGILKKIPCIVAVQASKSDNLVRNLNSDTFESRPASTTADSISVDVPRNFNMAKHYLHKYGGMTALVDDKEIIDASGILARNSGIFAEPAASAAMAGFLKYLYDGKTGKNSINLVLSTGSGLKDLKTPMSSFSLPEILPCSLESITKTMSSHDSI
ncbi:MAG: pyridoxal-phosphate dependent enzyme [Bacteroidales bacterium]|nr:pyridoxal-phosphate dependent enzyme [Bacteroidales bacterium]